MSIYHQLAEQGKLTAHCLNLAAYIEFHQNDPGGGGMVSQLDAQRNMEPDSNKTHSTIRPRFYDLEKFDVIERAGKKHDAISNRQVIGYRLTGRLVSEPSKERPIKRLLREALQHVPNGSLQAEIRERLKIAA